jgi:hypothetical protein
MRGQCVYCNQKRSREQLDKGKVVPLLFLTEHHAMKVYWGVEV